MDLIYGLTAGFGFAGLAVGVMLPMEFPDKNQAILAAFFSRFSIGFIIPLLNVPIPLWLAGAGIGLLLSLSDAIITRAYKPILGMGTLGGGLIGLIVGLLR